MKRMLITGGSSDIAKYLSGVFLVDQEFCVVSPCRSELDVTSIESVDAYFSDRTFDVVINCAGSLYASTLVDSDPLRWINDIQSNLIGPYLVSRMALRKNKNCLIINIASTAAFNAYKDWTSYCAAKSGVIKLTQGMYKDGYRVIAICPGAINTKLRDGLAINNPNVMTIEEGAAPIISAVRGGYQAGDIIFYRKGVIIVNPDFIVDGV
ncbi:SDR family oxidoreductase [Aeromonas sanarellii]|uniref:SDR family NAD(P)-dependent oxidoreductase n=1 Tax=Aeromonas sanarellii TaxID=633415 RepID=UPI002DBC2AE9|nr:SDR family oxidoreductase [Aeromonas sanarellii]MEB6607470.1 SDR family oxidoreductase [Aeromonas sanarellii]